MRRRSRDAFFGIFAIFGYVLMIAYFGLMAFAKFSSEPPDIGMACLASAICAFSSWRLFCSIMRLFQQKKNEGQETTGDGLEDEED